MGKILFWFALCLTLVITTYADARNRVPTYIDDHGVRRIQKTGKIYRDYAAIRDFKRSNPKPKDGQAYDIDHIIPLAEGGADKPYNMRWVLTNEHRRKNGRPKSRP